MELRPDSHEISIKPISLALATLKPKLADGLHGRIIETPNRAAAAVVY
jgi:hypothetical protein